MIYFSDHAIKQGIRQKKELVIRYMYREYFPCILSMIEQNSGVYEDAEDIFQDGLMVLYRKFSKGSGKLDCSLKTYFYAICKNLWMRRLERTRKVVYRDDLEVNESTLKYQLREEELREEYLERLRYFQSHFLRLPKDCQTLLLMFLDKVPLKEIAKVMGVSGVKYIKTRKYACKNMLRKKIMNDPACQPYILKNEKRSDQ
jgi:RNA polymerase sigma factor (sigma-70 family)